jgi:C4-dicarboxylate-specific signal transduction histidine kinase
LGFDPREGLPRREAVAQRTHPDDRERVREEARRAVREKRDYKLEYRILLPAGIIKHIEMNAHPKFSEGGQLVEVVSTLIDVTERKRAQEEHERLRQLESELAHMNRLSMMGELAASLAHEVTQPIAAARNNARAAQNFLDMQPPDFGEVRERSAMSSAMRIERETSSTGSVTTSRKRRRESIVLISMKRSMR